MINYDFKCYALITISKLHSSNNLNLLSNLINRKGTSLGLWTQTMMKGTKERLRMSEEHISRQKTNTSPFCMPLVIKALCQKWLEVLLRPIWRFWLASCFSLTKTKYFSSFFWYNNLLFINYFITSFTFDVIYW